MSERPASEPSACRSTEERLVLLRYGELPQPEQGEVLAHLEGCSACRALRAALEEATARLDRVPLELPPPSRRDGLKARVLAAVAAEGCPRELEGVTRDGPPTAEEEAHLAACAACREALTDARRVGLALDRVPPPPPLDAAARAELTERVLAAVEAEGAEEGCPWEAELLVRADLDPAAAEALEGHLAGCAACREAAPALVGVAAALDAVAVPALDASARARLRAGIAAVTGAPLAGVQAGPSPAAAEARPSGRLLRFPRRALAAAAALLLAGLLGLGAASLRPAPSGKGGAGDVAALEMEAEVLVRSGRADVLAQARSRYEAVLRRTRGSQDPRFEALAADARHQLAALRRMEVDRTPLETEVALAGTGATPRKGTTAPGITAQISYPAVVVEFPDSLASLHAMQRCQQELARRLASGDPLRYPFTALRPGNRALEGFVQRILRGEGGHPARLRVEEKRQIIRYDYEGLRQLVDARIADPKLRQAVRLQAGMHAEELGVIARSEGRPADAATFLAEARQHYRAVLTLGEDTPAGRLARQRLTRLG